MLADYKRITDKIIPRTRKLLVPYLQTLELKIRPGMVTLTWSSMNIGTSKNLHGLCVCIYVCMCSCVRYWILFLFFKNTDSYKNSIFFGLHRLEEMVMKINDIVENRIHKNLRLITKTILVSLPNDRAMTLEEFVEMQEASVSSDDYCFYIHSEFIILSCTNALLR